MHLFAFPALTIQPINELFKINQIPAPATSHIAYFIVNTQSANGWSGEMIRNALSQGKSLVVDQNGDVWTYNEWGHVCDYVGKVR